MATLDHDHPVDDIEKQVLQSTPPPSPPPIIQNPNVDNSENIVDVAAESTLNPTANTTISSTDPTTSLPSKIGGAILLVIGYVIIVTFWLLAFPFVLVYMIGSVCLFGSIKSPTECYSCEGDREDGRLSGKPTPKGIYKKMQDFKSTKEKIQRLNEITTTRAGCLALSWLVVNLCVPSLAKVTVFHYPLWKWTLLAVVILLGYPVTTIVNFFLLAIITLFNDTFTKQSNLEYFLGGLQDSLTSFLHLVSILVVWLFYFRTDRGLRPSEQVDKFGTWTFVAVLVGAVLWVLKSATLLGWKANAVYKRLKGRILVAGFQLYFLSKIIDESCFPALLPWRDDSEVQDNPSDNTGVEMADNNNNASKDMKNLRIQDSMLSKDVAMHQIVTVARRITDLALVALRENDGIPEIVAKCRKKIPTHDARTILTHEALRDILKLSEDDAKLLLLELKGEHMSEEITYDAFHKWVVDAHKNCLSVGYTLIDAFAVASVLNRVLIGFIVVIVILVWLLITGLATTTALVLIASPLLAFSFVFGDTCKTFFQGIIFSFVTHPYDVGDRCIIDGIELEVKRIGILTTMFVRIGTKEKVLYPTTSLVTKVITNLEGEPDPSDVIELILDSSTTKAKILKLKKDVERFFESSDRHGSYEKNIHMAVKEIGSSIKVSIFFTHVMNVQDVSHSQCLQKKNKQRSQLLIDVKQFLEDNEIKLATS